MSWSGGGDQNAGTPSEPKRRAAQYVRMSTEHQRYSTENQSDAIARYAEDRGIEIVRTYSDEGKSGLRLQGRDGLKRLIERWCRFLRQGHKVDRPMERTIQHEDTQTVYGRVQGQGCA